MLRNGAGTDAAMGIEGSRSVPAPTWMHKSKEQLPEKAGSVQALL